MKLLLSISSIPKVQPTLLVSFVLSVQPNPNFHHYFALIQTPATLKALLVSFFLTAFANPSYFD